MSLIPIELPISRISEIADRGFTAIKKRAKTTVNSVVDSKYVKLTSGDTHPSYRRSLFPARVSYLRMHGIRHSCIRPLWPQKEMPKTKQQKLLRAFCTENQSEEICKTV